MSAAVSLMATIARPFQAEGRTGAATLSLRKMGEKQVIGIVVNGKERGEDVRGM